MSDVIEEAQGFADRFIKRLNDNREAKPRVASTSIPWRRTNNQWANLLCGPIYSQANRKVSIIKFRRKCIRGDEHEAASVLIEWDDIKELERPRCILVKTTHKRQYWCLSCFRQVFRREPQEDANYVPYVPQT